MNQLSLPVLEEGVYHGQLDEDGKMPVSLFLPQSYEPGYPYPLLVFLHGHGERETQWLNAVPSLSRRNYIGIGLRGPHAIVRKNRKRGYGWGRDRRCDGALEDYILAAVRETMRTCNVNPERVFLAGICEGAAIAYSMGLSFPDLFAGVIALNGWLPPGPLPLWRTRELRSLSVFIGHGTENDEVPVHKSQEAHRLLYTAGLDVETRFYPTDHRLDAAMLKDLDRWVMQCCNRKRS